MKKYLITIKFKKLEVVRMFVGAISGEWAQKVANSLVVDLWRGEGNQPFALFEAVVQEFKINEATLDQN